MNRFQVGFLLIFVINGLVRSHCPHMMGHTIEKPSGPSPPGKLPDGDKGWDYDESAAPGILPEPHFIQSTYVYRSSSDADRKFSSRVITVLRNLRESLAKQARTTIENENVECSNPTDHYRCQEYPTSGSYNYLIIEDEKKGAVVYKFERKLNEKNDGTIEMALLDAFSRHSPRNLLPFASIEAEKEVGYIRALDGSETKNLSKPARKQLKIEKYSPNELKLVEEALLEVRTGKFGELSNKLVKFNNQAEFDDALEKHRFVFVLFWNNNRMVSLHTIHTLSLVAEQFNHPDDVIFGHVSCHESGDFCHGLNGVDFQTIVAYREGQNIGKTEKVGDVDYYVNWIQMMLNGPLYEIKDEEEMQKIKKGLLFGKKREAITIGVFAEQDAAELQHYRIAADKLYGRYYMAYRIVEGAEATINVYRPNEKQKRVKYDGRFDPASLLAFITQSSLPSIIDISDGFTTNLLLRRKQAVLILIAAKDYSNANFEKLSTRLDARKSYVFTRLVYEQPMADVLTALGVKHEETPILVVVNKDRVHHIAVQNSYCPDHLLKMVEDSRDAEPDFILSTKDAHPLRMLQKIQVDRLFGFQESIVLPDHTLFLDIDPFEKHHEIMTNAGSGGCPFMQGNQANHDEL